MVFDNDGLLLDTEEAWTRAELTLFARHGREFTMEHKRDLLGSSRVTAAVKLQAMLELPGEGEKPMDELIDLVMDEALAGVEPRPGALQLLGRLADVGIPLGGRIQLRACLSRADARERGAARRGAVPDDRLRTGRLLAEARPGCIPRGLRASGRRPGRIGRTGGFPDGRAAAAAAGMFVIGVPYFEGASLPGATLTADRLDDPSIAASLGLPPDGV